MAALLIDDVIRDRIAAIIAYAIRNPYTTDMLLDLKNKEHEPAGNEPKYVIDIPIGFRCVYTVDVLGDDTFRHLSVSVDRPGKLPSIPAVEMLMKEFGFVNDLNNLYNVFIENTAINEQAINVMEKIVNQ